MDLDPHAMFASSIATGINDAGAAWPAMAGMGAALRFGIGKHPARR